MLNSLNFNVCRFGILLVATLGLCQKAGAQKDAAQAPGEYVLRTYEIGDLVITIQDHPYSEALQRLQQGGRGMMGGGGGVFSVPDAGGPLGMSTGGGSGRFQFAQMGGGRFGGGGGGMGGGAMGMADENRPASESITIEDLIRVLTNTVEADSWSVNGGGDGNVEPLGTTLVVWQKPEVHNRIGELLGALREGSAKRKTVTIDARWLMLTSDEVDALVPTGQKGVPEALREKLEELTRRPGSIRGMTSCLSSQLVYIVSGTMKNVVSSFIPVVGSVESAGRELQLASLDAAPPIHFVADTSVPSSSRDVGYQPIVSNLNFGAVLEIRPTLVPGQDKGTAIVDLKSTVTVAGDTNSGEGTNAASDKIAPAVDRIAIETQEFATTLRVPVSTPVLVGGLTYIPSSARDGKETNAANAALPEGERPQLYLVLEVR